MIIIGHRDGNYRAQVFEFGMGKTERSMRGHHSIIFAWSQPCGVTGFLGDSSHA